MCDDERPLFLLLGSQIAKSQGEEIGKMRRTATTCVYLGGRFPKLLRRCLQCICECLRTSGKARRSHVRKTKSVQVRQCRCISYIRRMRRRRKGHLSFTSFVDVKLQVQTLVLFNANRQIH